MGRVTFNARNRAGDQGKDMAKRKGHRRAAASDPGRPSELARAIRLSLQMLAAGSFIVHAPTTYAAPPPPPLPNTLPSPAAKALKDSGTVKDGDTRWHLRAGYSF